MSPYSSSRTSLHRLNSTYIPHTCQNTESNTKNRHRLLASITSSILCIHIPLIVGTFYWRCAQQLTYTHVTSFSLISFRWLWTTFVFRLDLTCRRNTHLEAIYNDTSDHALLVIHCWQCTIPVSSSRSYCWFPKERPDLC